MNSMANRYPFAASASCATRSSMNPGWNNPHPKYGYKGKNPLKSIMQVPNRTSLSGFKKMLYGRCQQVDDADERVIVAVSPGPAFGGLEDAIERLDACVAVA